MLRVAPMLDAFRAQVLCSMFSMLLPRRALLEPCAMSFFGALFVMEARGHFLREALPVRP